MASLLIVDDNQGIRTTLSELLSSENHDTVSLMTAEDALVSFKKNEPDLILLDLALPGMNGFQFLHEVKKLSIHIPVIIITSYSDVASAVKAMRLGAYDYITKPFNLDEIVITVDKALDSKQREDHLAYLRRKNQPLGFDKIIGNSPEVKKVYNFIRQLSSAPNTSVLIRGETGTGKELVAQAIHQNSSRSNKPFIEINCSAFQENLLEAEFMGFEAGAFTGAITRKKGLLELADNGSFFMDEVGDMPMSLQAKILKVIEEQTFRRIGGIKELKVNTRIISATSRNLEKHIESGDFRKDLFYRLNVASIILPPLRERGEDILLLANHFLNQFNKEFKKSIQGFADTVKEKLVQYSWPGNVRELKNMVERAVLFEEGVYIQPDNLNFHTDHSTDIFTEFLTDNFPSTGISIENVEKSLITSALSRARGNQTQAARLLNLSRETLKYRLKKYQITVE